MAKILKILAIRHKRIIKRHSITTFGFCSICGHPVPLGREDCDTCQKQLAYMASFYDPYKSSLAMSDTEEWILEGFLALRPPFQNPDGLLIECECPICRGKPDDDRIFKEKFEHIDGIYSTYLFRGNEDYYDEDNHNDSENGYGGPGTGFIARPYENRYYYDYSSEDSDNPGSDDYLDDDQFENE